MRWTMITQAAIVAIGAAAIVARLPSLAAETPAALPAMLPTTQASSFVCDPEVRELIPAIRVAEELYTKMRSDMEFSGAYTLENKEQPGDRPVDPQMIQSMKQVFTLIQQGHSYFVDARTSYTTGRGQSESTQQLVCDSKIWRTLLTRPGEKYREAAVLATAFPSNVPQLDPYCIFTFSQAEPISQLLQTGMFFDKGTAQRWTRISDADCLGRRCVRLQLQADAIIPADNTPSVTVTLWLCPEIHYLPLKLESRADEAFMKKHPGVDASMVMSALDLQEIAPGTFYPTEVHMRMGGSSRHWTFDRVKLHPNYAAATFTELTVPDGTELKVFYKKKVIAHDKTDDQWNMDAAAALLADTILNDSPTTAPTTQEVSHAQQLTH